MHDAVAWKEAAQKEYDAQLLNGTWVIEDLPPRRKAIGSRWVFARKYREDGSLERHKARIVAKGFSQIEGVDYYELFAPVAKWESMRTMLHLAASEDWEIHRIDFDTAFLNGDLEETIYMKQPEGFQVGKPGQVFRLIKAMPGFKQASRAWYQKLDTALRELGFIRTKCDSNIYTLKKDGSRQILSVYVDNEVIAADSLESLRWTKKELQKKFKLKDQGDVKYILGVEIRRDRSKREILLCQRGHVNNIMEKFHMADAKEAATPMDKTPLSIDMEPQTEENRQFMAGIPYISAVASCIYLAGVTRPDISYAVGVLARFNKNPGPQHWKAVQRLLRYLKGTVNFALKLGGKAPPQLTGFSDADYAFDVDTRRSTSGMAWFVGHRLVAWRSKRQPVVTNSTTEAEYVAGVYAGSEGAFLRKLLMELGYGQNGPTPLHLDNQSAIAVGKNPEHHGRIKHMDINYYWLKERVAAGTFSLHYIRTDEMPADILTKPLLQNSHHNGVKMLGITTMPH